nr:fatty acid amide hydrolase 1 [Hymenolepis microstoma]
MKSVILRAKLRKRCCLKRKLLKEARQQLLKRVEDDPPSPELGDVSAIEIQHKLQKNIITPFQALRVYQKRVLDVLDCNGVCDIIEEAEESAKLISPKIKSPIWGMPVSIKENIAIAGYDSTIGLVNRCLKPCLEDSQLIKVLRKVGTVPYVTTTMSPTGMCLDASTKIFGKQRNPHDIKRLVGGSSSGEAILVSKGASPLGFGTDIAGSVRFPAALCGICALKPTSSRISTVGVISVSRKSCVGLRPVFGPMSKHVSLLVDSMRAILTPSMFDLDPRVPPIEFREEIFTSNKPLTIGFYDHIGGEIAPKPVPSIVNSLSQSKEILKAQGHKVVDFSIPNPDAAVHLAITGITADGGENLCNISHGEAANPRFRTTRFLLSMPTLLKRLIGKVVQSILNKAIGSAMLAATGCQTSNEVLTVLSEVSDYQNEFAAAWANAKIDVLLCPALPFPAPLENTPDVLLLSAITFSSIYNLVDYPAGVVRVSEVTEKDVEEAQNSAVEYRKNGDILNAKHSEWQRDTKGLPLVVQVVGKPFGEETVLRVMKEIEEGVKQA